jgi:hypothetical protein
MKALICFLLVISSSLSLRAADGGDRLNRWVGGTWVGTGTFLASTYSKASTASATTRCAWSPDHIFVLCDQDIVFGGAPMRDLSIYSFAPKTGKYYFYGVSLGEEKVRSTALEISDDGTRWVYSNTTEIAGKSVQFRITNQFINPDAVKWWTEFSLDEGKTWTKTGDGEEKRKK